MRQTVKYAGIAVVENGDDTKKLKFHTSKSKNQLVLWIKVPGKALFNFIKLPRTLSKVNAARYLLQHKDFKQPMYQKFLKEHITRRTNGTNGNGKTVSPRQRMPRRSERKQSESDESAEVA
jgi:hypothetical protein